MIDVKDLSYSNDELQILKNISITVEKNKIVGIIGANGCGKSTLLKNIYRLLKAQKGSIKVDDLSIDKYSSKDLAKKMAVLSQKQGTNFDFTVKEIVQMGRYSYRTSIFDKENNSIIEEALTKVGLSHLKDRSLFTLSGGEIQRVFIARAIAQNSDIFILDEPTNHLDIKYQLQIMQTIKFMEKTVLAVIHDMNIASMYCDYIYAMKDGKIILSGDTKSIFTVENIKKIFDIECEIISHPKNSRPVVIF